MLFCLLLAGSAIGQSVKSAGIANTKIKRIYVYQFAKNVDWPEKAKKGDFVIGVLGDESLYGQLKTTYAGKPIGSQSIAIKRFTSVSELSNCHILYIGDRNMTDLTAISKNIAGNKTLIVSNGDGALDKGATINFIIKNSQIKFEVSKKNAKKSDLLISEKLISLAAKVTE